MDNPINKKYHLNYFINVGCKENTRAIAWMCQICVLGKKYLIQLKKNVLTFRQLQQFDFTHRD